MTTKTQSFSWRGLSSQAQAAVITVLIVLGLAGLLTVALSSGPDCSVGEFSCVNIIQNTLSGVLVGGVYALVALGIVVINKASGVFNFAHGFMMLIGAWFFWEAFTAPLSPQLALIFAALSATMPVALMIARIDSNTYPPDANRLQRWQITVTHRNFAVGMVIGLVIGFLIYYLLQNLNNDMLPGWVATNIGAPVLRGALGALIGAAIIGLLAERLAIRPLLGQPVLAAIMMTLAVALILQGATSLFWGQEEPLPVYVDPPQQTIQRTWIGLNPDGTDNFLETVSTIPGKVKPAYVIETEAQLGKNLQFPRNLVWGFVICIICFMLFVLFFQFTSMGLAMRAVSENQVLAESVGLRVRTILAVAWGIAAIMAMIAGVVQGTGQSGISKLVIPPLAFRAFPAVLLGGLESITGALVGGIIIGVVEYLTLMVWDSSAAQEFAPFFVLLVVLMIRPEGLFGQHRIERV